MDHSRFFADAFYIFISLNKNMESIRKNNDRREQERKGRTISYSIRATILGFKPNI